MGLYVVFSGSRLPLDPCKIFCATTRRPENRFMRTRDKPLKRFLNEARDELSAMHKSIGSKAIARGSPEVLYHYTDANGLRGIVGNGTLWLSDIYTMNDPNELRHGMSLCLETLHTCCADSVIEFGPYLDVFDSIYMNRLSEFAQGFAICFSGDRSVTPLWSYYGDAHQGFALGFRSRSLEDALTHAMRKDAIKSALTVLYDDALLRAEAIAALRLFASLFWRAGALDLTEYDQKSFMTDASVMFSAYFVRLSALFKDPAFDHEQEYRFLSIYPEMTLMRAPPKVRDRNGTPIMYIEMGWKRFDPDCLVEVVTGSRNRVPDEEIRSILRDGLGEARANKVRIVRL
ncbi:MAG TPA: DUF2971 domain-containing protein [Geminicoccus sp.]|uniref:DUF2971 domain-containing protein n=1 Tax=Geminicoccus sp. TaxID=2024832 RepID=UPI002E308079|nr:DUF2971 domain-containing protein [Geminicoccus sp.]HEX2526765.1 DUF2971 domain-containing protein [Geminicoccus sp.]